MFTVCEKSLKMIYYSQRRYTTSMLVEKTRDTGGRLQLPPAFQRLPDWEKRLSVNIIRGLTSTFPTGLLPNRFFNLHHFLARHSLILLHISYPAEVWSLSIVSQMSTSEHILGKSLSPDALQSPDLDAPHYLAAEDCHFKFCS